MRPPSLLVSVVALLTLAGCGDPRPSDPELGAQIWGHAETGGEVRTYQDCLEQVARNTKPSTDLALERIESVLAGCTVEESLLIAEVERIWKDESRDELDGRIRGVRIEALRIVKDTPYVPGSVVVPN